MKREIVTIAGVVLGMSLIVHGVSKYITKKNAAPTAAQNDIRNNPVMIVNRAMNHGGTGLILKSTPSKSYILTNGHVCKVVEDNGGLVIKNKNSYQAHSYIESQQSDLCLVTVLDDLHTNTRISQTAPETYSDVQVSGFPALMPNIISKGHLSGRSVIPVIMGIQPCTEEDEKEDPLTCLFMGGKPVVKYYESVLTSATIMPGNSGSGVYNSDNDLIGVVFAGQGDLGYSWTVPYEQVINFLYSEARHLPETLINQSMVFGGRETRSVVTIKSVIDKCKNERPTQKELVELCSLISKDMIWRK